MQTGMILYETDSVCRLEVSTRIDKVGERVRGEYWRDVLE